jgi:probable phosphoglycerate mutase
LKRNEGGSFLLHLYITRHGETKWNKEKRLQGWKDSELTEKGVKNAISLGERLRDVSFHAVYSSSSGRAVKTAKLICSDRNIPIHYDDDLKEINLGDWEGKISEEIEENSKKEFFHFWNSPHLYNHEPHKGESFQDLKRRVEKASKKMIAAHTDGNILVVTHGVALRAMLSIFMNIPTEKWWDGPVIEGTSLTLVQFDGEGFHLKMLGDTSHFSTDAETVLK